MNKRNHLKPVKLAMMISAFFCVAITSVNKKEAVKTNAYTAKNATTDISSYYSTADGKTESALRVALYNIIRNHTQGTYGDAYIWLRTIDKKGDDTMWDMYSDIPGDVPPYTFTASNACGSEGYKGEGDCWNREHIIPQSIFNEASPMVSDVHHLYATDGYVNNYRSNYPFGEIQSANWTSLNGSKRGPGKSTMGYTSTVFEPIDEYKGDIARSIMYMAVRYQDVMSGWGNFAMFDKASVNLGLSTWARNLLLKWNFQDPVSEKEITRNNQIYDNYQHNRNPFVDRANYACSIWGNIDEDARDICASAPIEDTEVENVINLINTMGIIDSSSESKIIAAETAYALLTIDQKANVTNYFILTQARQTYDELKAQIVINLINNIGEVTLSSKSKLDQAQNAYNALDNTNQKNLVTNYVDLSLKQLTYNDLLIASDLIPSLENATWSDTNVESSPHTITEQNRAYGLSSGKLENGETHLGADTSNASKLVFNEDNGFIGLESTLTGTYSYYAGFMMLDFAFSNPTSITFSWSNVTTTFEVSLLASFDGGYTWETIDNLNSVTQGGAISWNNNLQNKGAKNLANPSEHSFAQYAIVVGFNTPGYMENLLMAASFAGRQVDTDSNLDTLIALVETADTCQDFTNSLDLGLLYDQLDLEDKQIFDNHVGLDGVNVKTKLDYMIYLQLHSQSTGSGSPSLLDTIKNNQTLVLVSVIAISLLLTIAYIQKRKTAIADC